MTRSKRLTADTCCGDCSVQVSRVCSSPSSSPISLHAQSTHSNTSIHCTILTHIEQAKVVHGSLPSQLTTFTAAHIISISQENTGLEKNILSTVITLTSKMNAQQLGGAGRTVILLTLSSMFYAFIDVCKDTVKPCSQASQCLCCVS